MKRPEEALQRAIVARLRARLEPPWLFWATANQRGTRKAWEQAMLKAMGTRAGIPDLFVAGPNRVLVGLEVKAPPETLRSGNVSRAKPNLSDAQKDTIAALEACGFPTIVVRDLDDAIAALSTLGATFRGRVM